MKIFARPGRMTGSVMAAAVLCTLNTLANAGVIDMSTPVFNPANGSYYAYVTAPAPGLTWEESRVQSKSLEFLGMQGHLACITTAQENQFLVDNLTFAVGGLYWIGGFQLPGSGEPAGGWQWVTGESFDLYTNWEPTNPEPNDGDGHGEDKLSFWKVNYKDPYTPGDSIGWWNDEPDWFQGPGYVVEFQVPSPAGVAVLGLGALVGAKRRRR